jgi:hypothetical protein
VPKGKPQPIDITSLEFDPQNPRTAERLSTEASQAKIQEFLLAGEMRRTPNSLARQQLLTYEHHFDSMLRSRAKDLQLAELTSADPASEGDFPISPAPLAALTALVRFTYARN